MRYSTPGKTPFSTPLASREDKHPLNSSCPTAHISAELASLVGAEETRLVVEAGNVGLEQLIAALTRIPIPRRRKKTSNGAT
jgi:hypothetical protein